VKKVENQHFDEAYDLSDENDESGKGVVSLGVILF
jgi:hypothetical protein